VEGAKRKSQGSHQPNDLGFCMASRRKDGSPEKPRPDCRRDEDGMTPGERAFCNAYMMNGNMPTAAAREAGYSCPGKAGWGLMKRQKVIDFIQKEQKNRGLRLNITEDAILAEFMLLASSDIGKVCSWDENGVITVKDSEEIPPETRRAICEIFNTPTGGLRIKMHSKDKALDALAKHKGMFIERHQHQHDHHVKEVHIIDDRAKPGLPKKVVNEAEKPKLLEDGLVE